MKWFKSKRKREQEELLRIAEADRKHHMPAYAGDASAVMRLGCYHCNGPLKIYYLPAGKSLIGAAMGWTCQSCGMEWNSDGVRNQPPWVEELGQEIITKPQTEGQQNDGQLSSESALSDEVSS